ncbi:hypothetical protein DPEC_G00083650 [Dallia pectoralis]|uniref:Uncharacterized protein n=1 Tax=Dallia pectoralis TaxID=75939 RepID=A0ACC2GZ35_DALPE|nr:hypothetical protein DPEC_G00083650 [Dallia pectoralis]
MGFCPAESQAVPKTSTYGGGWLPEMGKVGENELTGGMGRMLNNHSSTSARLEGWGGRGGQGDCLNAAFKGVILIPVKKAQLTPSSSHFSRALIGR